MFLSNLPKHICKNASLDLRSLGKKDRIGIRLVLKLKFNPKIQNKNSNIAIKQSSSVTEKGRAHRNPTTLSALPAPGPWTAQPLTVRLTFMGTHPALKPSPLCLLIRVQFDRPIRDTT
jgi:hypothetical protein